MLPNGKEFTKPSTKPAWSLVWHSHQQKLPKCRKYVGKSLQCFVHCCNIIQQCLLGCIR